MLISECLVFLGGWEGEKEKGGREKKKTSGGETNFFKLFSLTPGKLSGRGFGWHTSPRPSPEPQPSPPRPLAPPR